MERVTCDILVLCIRVHVSRFGLVCVWMAICVCVRVCLCLSVSVSLCVSVCVCVCVHKSVINWECKKSVLQTY